MRGSVRLVLPGVRKVMETDRIAEVRDVPVTVTASKAVLEEVSAVGTKAVLRSDKEWVFTGSAIPVIGEAN